MLMRAWCQHQILWHTNVIEGKTKVNYRVSALLLRTPTKDKNILLLFKKESCPVLSSYILLKDLVLEPNLALKIPKGLFLVLVYPMCWIFYVPNHPNLVTFQYKPIWNMDFYGCLWISMDFMESSRHSKSGQVEVICLKKAQNGKKLKKAL